MEKLTERMKANHFHLETKIKVIKAGASKVFQSWQEWGLITEDEFIDALTWLCDDPLTEDGRLTRELGMIETEDMRKKQMMARPNGHKFASSYDESKLKGELVKLKRVYDERGNFVGFYRIDTGLHFGGSGSSRVSISPMDRI